jgi:hypothetical protein
MTLTIQSQRVQERCRHCGASVEVVRGPVFEGDAGVGLYLVGLHRCASGGSAVMTVSLLDQPVPRAFTIQAWPLKDEIGMAFVDGELSPWYGEQYLGQFLTADDARLSPLRPWAFEAADLICETIPEVINFLNELPVEPEDGSDPPLT